MWAPFDLPSSPHHPSKLIANRDTEQSRAEQGRQQERMNCQALLKKQEKDGWERKWSLKAQTMKLVGLALP